VGVVVVQVKGRGSENPLPIGAGSHGLESREEGDSKAKVEGCDLNQTYNPSADSPPSCREMENG